MGRKKNSKKKKRSKGRRDSRRATSPKRDSGKAIVIVKKINPDIAADARAMGIAIGGLSESEVRERIASLRS